MSNKINLKVKERYVKIDENKNRDFQNEVFKEIKNDKNKIIIVDAPVGSGKSYIFQKVIFAKEINQGKNIIVNYPTKILLESQIAQLKYETKNVNIAIWPEDENFPLEEQNTCNVYKYSSDSLFKYFSTNPNSFDNFTSKGELLGAGLFMHSKSEYQVFATTPDVLYMIYSNKYRKNWSQEIKAQLKHSIVFIDEFHLYYQLDNFYKLLNELIDKVDKIVLLSATSIIKQEELEKLINEKKIKIKHIYFKEPKSENKIIFNYPLEITIHNFKYTDISLTLNKLYEILPEIETPAAIIFDSLFRLKHLIKDLKKLDEKEGGKYKIREWNGLTKSKDILQLIKNQENVIIIGTSSIEVGVDMKLKTLITEASLWTQAIQRLGRVGRISYNSSSNIDDNKGTVHLFINSIDLPNLLKKQEYERTEFESIIQQGLKDPKSITIYSNMFRGESFNFVLIDEYINEPIFYNQNIFSIYDIDEYRCYNFLGDRNEKEELLKDIGIKNNEHIREILIRDRIFPIWGILESDGLRNEYIPIESIEKKPLNNPETIIINLKDRRYTFSKKLKKNNTVLPDAFL